MNTIPINTLWLILFFPLLGALINGLLGKKLPKAVVSIVGPGAILASFITVVYHTWLLAGFEAQSRRFLDVVYTWLGTVGLDIQVSFVFDPLSAVMALIITGVGFFIHLYSIGYMADDKGYYRYFAYLNLFVFSMLVLVLGGNMVMMFIGWEGVGVCSYLLIGFWFQHKANADAGKKAFIVNRIGDVGFLLGTFLIFVVFRSFDFEAINTTILNHGGMIPSGVYIAIAALLFIGAMGKSAQIPLHVWLPDAMAGPTPVSALIHAATMVTAGVYMIARLNLIYINAPDVMLIVAWVGAITALFAASIALVQTDIKKVLAYSTVSQLGFMFLAMGVGAWAAGIFHLMTHAFFKACLFLGSGSVIHAMGGEQDVRKMGGLRKWMPITYATFLIATFAIAGIPPFSGFFSKDEILFKAYGSVLGGQGLWAVAALAALFTAFYMTRVLILTFHGENRSDPTTRSHLHESPWTMTIPLVVLAVLSLVGGYLGVPEPLKHWWPTAFFTFFAPAEILHGWLGPVFQFSPVSLKTGAEAAEHTLVVLAVLSALIAIAAAIYLYRIKTAVPERLGSVAGGIPHRVLLNKYYVDEIYDYSIIKPIFHTSRLVLWRFIDVIIIDGIVNGTATVARFLGQIGRRVQTGDVQAYAVSVIVGAIALVGYLVYGWWN